MNKRVRCDLTSSATDMVWVMEEPYFGTDGAVGLKSITYTHSMSQLIASKQNLSALESEITRRKIW